MNVFLQFAFNTENLRNHVREEWMTLYDFSYIDDKIIGGIEKNLPNVSDILRKVEKRATGKVTSALSLTETNDQSRMNETGGLSRISGTADDEPQPKKATVPQPFNITKPKPKVIP